MTKEQLDELYHLLRVASNDTTPSGEEAACIRGLVGHLLLRPNYEALVRYCAMYGGKFLLEPTADMIIDSSIRPNRIVELGAGLGWLGRGIAAKFGYLPTLFVDKRPWALIDEQLDLEKPDDVEKLKTMLNPDDLIVMCDFLHCIEKPMDLINALADWNIVLLEYFPSRVDYRESFDRQLYRYGASLFPLPSLQAALQTRMIQCRIINPYVLYLLGKAKPA